MSSDALNPAQRLWSNGLTKWRVQFLRLICCNSQTIGNREEGLINVGKQGGAMSFSGLRCSGANNHKTPALLVRSLITGNPKVKPVRSRLSKIGPIGNNKRHLSRDLAWSQSCLGLVASIERAVGISDKCKCALAR